MGLQKLPTRSLDTEERRRLVAERINGVLSHDFDDSKTRTAAEVAAGIYPTNQAYPPGDIRRYGAVGDASTDCTAAINNAIAVIRASTTGGGEVFIPEGDFRITSSINCTGFFFTNQLKIRGAGRYSATILAAVAAAPVIDLSGSAVCSFSSFSIRPVATFTPHEVILCARLTSNNSAGDHRFTDMWIEGACSKATVVLWGSEQNQFYSSIIWSNANVPALAAAVKISELFTAPTSPFVTLGTGEGGVGMQGFFGCRFGNETGTEQTSPLLRLYGTLGTVFYNCFYAAWTPNTIDINSSTYPSDSNSVYPSTITFDTCSDENPFDATDAATQRTIYFSAVNVAAQTNVRGLCIRNCQFFRIYGEDDFTIDGLCIEGGKFSNSVASPTGSKLSVYNLKNATILSSNAESGLTYTVRNAGTANFYRGIANGNVALGTDTTSVISDASGNLLHGGYILSKSPTGGVGYSAGAGGTVTQITSAATAVTLNKVVGNIITVALTTAAGAEEVFQAINSTVTVNDILAVSTTYTGAGTPAVSVKGVANGGFVIVITNLHSANALDAAMTINFAVIRGITS